MCAYNNAISSSLLEEAVHSSDETIMPFSLFPSCHSYLCNGTREKEEEGQETDCITISTHTHTHTHSIVAQSSAGPLVLITHLLTHPSPHFFLFPSFFALFLPSQAPHAVRVLAPPGSPHPQGSRRTSSHSRLLVRRSLCPDRLPGPSGPPVQCRVRCPSQGLLGPRVGGTGCVCCPGQCHLCQLWWTSQYLSLGCGYRPGPPTLSRP